MADRYWVGGTGNWDASTTTHWGSASGVADSASVPTSSDNVIFDTLSNATAFTVTVTATANCLNLTIGNPLTGVITFAGGSGVNVAGNLALPAGGTISNTGSFTMTATSGTKTITSNGTSFVNMGIILNGVGGTFQLADNLTTGKGNAGAFTRTNGTFDANGKTVTLTASTGSVTGTFTGSNAFFNLTKQVVGAANTPLTGDIEVTGTLTLTTDDVRDRIFLYSSVVGTPRTVTAATVAIDGTDFRDIIGAGAASWNLSAITYFSGDCGGNSGITFTTPTTNYWVPAGGTSTGNMEDVTRWASSSGGTAGTGRSPLPQDTAIFNASSIDAGSRTITQNKPRIGTIDFTGATNTPTFTTSTTASVFGSLTLISGMTLTASTNGYTFEGRGAYTITNAGKTWEKQITINAPGGTLTLTDNMIVGAATSRLIRIDAGTLDLDGKTLTHFGTVTNSGSVTRAVDFGTAGVWDLTLNTATTVWSASGSGFTTSGTGTIKISGSTTNIRTFAGGGFTYKDLWFSNATNAGQLTITDSNTFTDIKAGIEGNAQTILFTASTTTTVTTFTVNGASGNLITLNSSTTTDFNLVKSGGGTISCDYLSIQNSDATPASTWYAGTHSTNNQGATGGTGWIFTAPPAPSTRRVFIIT